VTSSNESSKTIAAIVAAVSSYLDDENIVSEDIESDLRLNKWKMLPLESVFSQRWQLFSSRPSK
tara:strand:- start:221 stop:412 length:192 start_codon:yes stop_codon:yes gene_type:complete